EDAGCAGSAADDGGGVHGQLRGAGWAVEGIDAVEPDADGVAGERAAGDRDGVGGRVVPGGDADGAVGDGVVVEAGGGRGEHRADEDAPVLRLAPRGGGEGVAGDRPVGGVLVVVVVPDADGFGFDGVVRDRGRGAGLEVVAGLDADGDAREGVVLDAHVAVV